MTAIYSGDSVTFPDATVQVSAQVGLKNRVMNGGFVLNQRVYVSGTALASGSYGHDRFKGGASGGTYTFTQGSLGVNTTATITAGSLIQIIEGCNVAEGGTYILSWTGTAQGRLNSGTYGSSGTVTITGWVAGTNLPVEFNTGTVGNIQLEKGLTASTFDYRPYGTELILCQRYYELFGSGGTGGSRTSSSFSMNHKFQVIKRASPTVTHLTNYSILLPGVGSYTASAVTSQIASITGTQLTITSSSGAPSNSLVVLVGDASAGEYLSAASEL